MKKTNAIETIVKTSQGATVKTSRTKPSLNAVETLDLITSTAKSFALGDKASTDLEQALKAVNSSALNLHKGGVRLLDGRKKDPQTQQYRQAFLDQCEKSGLKAKTSQNYYEMFYNIVNSGKELKAFNYKSNAKKNGTDKAETALADILAKLYNHSGFEGLSEELQSEVTELLTEAKYI